MQVTEMIRNDTQSLTSEHKAREALKAQLRDGAVISITPLKKEHAPPHFPITIKKGHAVVKIYAVRNRETTNYTVAYMNAASGRKRKTFADLELAKREAHNIAADLADGDLEALKLTGA